MGSKSINKKSPVNLILTTNRLSWVCISFQLLLYTYVRINFNSELKTTQGNFAHKRAQSRVH